MAHQAINQFNLQAQYERYLFLMDLNESEMPEVQKIETKRAFYGACGQMLMLFPDMMEMVDPTEMLKQYEGMIKQVEEFLNQELKPKKG